MSFIYPYFLFGLTAISIPIIIHLFNLQKTKRIYFSNTSFLKNVQNLSKRSIKVKNLYILLARIFFIVFLVLAFAQPFIASQETNDADFIDIYIDNSLSSQSSIGNDRVLDISVKNIQSFSEALPPDALINIYSNDNDNNQNQFINRSKVGEAVGNIRFSPRSKTFNEALQKERKRFDNAKGKKRASYIFSDFQKSFLEKKDGYGLDSVTKYFLVPVTPEKVSNVYIDSIWLESPLININENNQLKATVVNSGNDAKENVLLKLTIEGRQVATTSINVGPNAQNTATFNFNVVSGGYKNGVISISDYPVVFDNNYYFSLSTSEKIKVLEVVPSSNASPYVQKVFFNKELFDYTQKSLDNLDFNSIINYDLLVLNNLPDIPEGINLSLNKFIENSSALVVIPSAKSNLKTYNQLLNPYSIIINNIADSTEGKYELQQPNLSNPFFGGIFDNQKERMVLPSEVPKISWNNIGSNLLMFKDGQAFFTLVNTGKGKIYMFASDLKSNTGLGLNALFVPIIYKIAFSSKSSNGKLAYHFDDRLITIPLKKAGKNDVFKLVKNKLEIIPGQRITSKGLVLEMPENLLETGHYQLKLNDSIISNISFNYSTKESIMEFYNPEELKEIFAVNNNVEILDDAIKSELADNIKEARTGLPLWKIALLIALLFLFIEILLLRFYKVQETIKT